MLNARETKDPTWHIVGCQDAAIGREVAPRQPAEQVSVNLTEDRAQARVVVDLGVLAQW